MRKSEGFQPGGDDLVSAEGQTDQFELRRRLVQMEMLYEVGLALSESLDPTYVADELLQRALTMVDARSGLLMVRAEDGGAIQIIGRAGVECDEAEILQLPEIERAWGDNTAVQRDRETAACRYVCILPLECQGEVRGLLIVVDKESRDSGIGPFDESDESVLRSFSLQAGAALHNARLHRNLEETHRQLVAAQAKIVQLEQLRALGALAAEVTHSMRNTFGMIIGLADMYLTFPKDPKSAMTTIVEAAEKGASLIDRIQRASRLGVGESRILGDINDVVGGALADVEALMGERLAGKGIEVEWATELGELPLTSLNAADMKEVFTNLFLNAVEAMPSGGRIEVATSLAGDAIHISIRDPGTGMPEEVRERIFEPFFTTRDDAGLGLGLSIVFRIVEDHGGNVTVESEPGDGSTFTVAIPLVTELPPEPEVEDDVAADLDR